MRGFGWVGKLRSDPGVKARSLTQEDSLCKQPQNRNLVDHLKEGVKNIPKT